MACYSGLAWRRISQNGRLAVRRIFSILNAVIAIGAGLIVLIGYFVDVQGMKEVRLLLFQWAVIVGGVAVLLGLATCFLFIWQTA